VTRQLGEYHFSDVAKTVYEFTWSEFCDWYIEMSKGRLKKDEGGRVQDETVQRVLVGVLDGIVRLIHPVMPFVAESLWQTLNEAAFERGLPAPEPAVESVAIAPWPSYPAVWQDAAMERRMARMQELVRAVRDVRNRYTMKDQTPLAVSVRTSREVAGDFHALAPFITMLAGVGQLESGPDVHKPKQAASDV